MNMNIKISSPESRINYICWKITSSFEFTFLFNLIFLIALFSAIQPILQHSEFADLLKTYICPQVVKMIAGEREISLTTSLPSNASATHSVPQQSALHRPLSALPMSASLLQQQQLQQQQQVGHIVTKARDFPIMIRYIYEFLIIKSNFWVEKMSRCTFKTVYFS